MATVIIYDKDGTLMKFDSFWVPVARHALKELFLSATENRKLAVELTEKAELLAGVKNEKTDPSGVLCSGTYSQLAKIVTGVLNGVGYEKTVTKSEVEKAMSEAVKYGKSLPSSENLREKLLEAKKVAKLFVVTTDEPVITQICLERLKIADLFEKIYCDDGKFPHKPDPAAAYEIEKLTGADKSEIYMVGDTSTDCSFAMNAGINFVSVGTCEKIKSSACYNAANAAEATDYILSRFKGGCDCLAAGVYNAGGEMSDEKFTGFIG